MVKLEKIDYKKIKIETMKMNHVDSIKKVWMGQYSRITAKYNFLSEDWKDDEIFEGFIEKHINNDDSIVVRLGTDIVGYMTYDTLHVNIDEAKN